MLTGEVGNGVDEQVEIFEIDKHAEVQREVDEQDKPFLPAVATTPHEQSEQIVADADSEENEAIFG